MANAFLTGFEGGEITRLVTVTPTVQAAAYATGDLIGGKQTIAGAALADYGTGRIKSVTLISSTAFTVDLHVIFFTADPSGTTFTENGAINIVAADAAKVCGSVLLDQSAIGVDLGTPDVLHLGGLDIPYEITEAGSSLYACMRIGGAHTPGSTTGITMRYGLSLV